MSAPQDMISMIESYNIIMDFAQNLHCKAVDVGNRHKQGVV